MERKPKESVKKETGNVNILNNQPVKNIVAMITTNFTNSEGP